MIVLGLGVLDLEVAAEYGKCQIFYELREVDRFDELPRELTGLVDALVAEVPRIGRVGGVVVAPVVGLVVGLAGERAPVRLALRSSRRKFAS